MIDLHAHSNASDGSDSPTEFARLAAAAGLSAVALTDHDTIEGLAEATEEAGRLGVRLIPGCELSCEVARGGLHLVVLFVDATSSPLTDRLGGLQAGRGTRNERIVEVLQAEGFELTLDDVSAEAGSGSVGRPHIAAVLLEKGYVSSITEAFDVWLGNGRPAYVERDRLTPAEAIDLAHASGGVSVLAHPFTLDLEPGPLEAFVAELAGAGLDAIEVHYGRCRPDERQSLAALAERLGLCPSGGSDYHGTYKPDLSLGTGPGDLNVPDEWLDALEERRPAP